MSISLIGFPAGLAALNGRTVTVGERPPLAEATFFLRDVAGAPQAGAIGANVPATIHTIGSRTAAPRQYVQRWFADSVSGDWIIAPWGPGSRWDGLASGAMTGATLHVQRVMNGALTTLGELTVLEHVSHRSNRISGAGGSDDAPLMIGPGETSLRYRMAHRWLGGRDMHVWVRAVGADGRYGPQTATAQTTLDRVSAAVDYDLGGGIVSPAAVARPVLVDAVDAALPAPTGVTVTYLDDDDGHRTDMLVSWTPPDNMTGVVGWDVIVSSEPAGTVEGSRWRVAPGHGAQAGDMVTVLHSWRRADRGRIRTEQAGEADFFGLAQVNGAPWWIGERSAPWDYDIVDGDAGAGVRYFYRYVIPAGESLTIGWGSHSGTSQDSYQVLSPDIGYRMAVRARLSAGTAEMRLSWLPENNTPLERVAIGTTWTDVEVIQSPAVEATTGGKGSQELKITAPAGQDAVLELAWARTSHENLEWGQLDPRYSEMAGATLHHCRAHNFIKRKFYGAPLDHLLGDAGTDYSSFNRPGDTLHQTIRSCAALAPRLWLQLDPVMLGADWTNLVEYLAAPAGAGPWADRRAALGQAAPWTDVFDEIIFEVGNELWNTAKDFESTVPTGTLAGQIAEWVYDRLEASPWWPALAAKCTRATSSWMADNDNWTSKFAAASPRTDRITIAPYLLGWESGISAGDPTLPESFRAIINLTQQKTEPDHKNLVAKADGRGGGAYEMGPSYNLPFGGQSAEARRAEDLVAKSQAAAVGTFDSVAVMAMQGGALQSYFTLGEEGRWTSHQLKRLGGWPWPQWHALQMWTDHMSGTLLSLVDVQRPGQPLPKIDGIGHRPALADSPLVGIYAAREGSRLSVACVSRRVPGAGVDVAGDGFTPLRLHLPIGTYTSLTLHRLWAPYDAHNLDAHVVQPESIPLDVPTEPRLLTVDATTGADARGLPPASIFIYRFEGVEW